MVYFHGFPGSRLEARILDSAAFDLNARIIGIDRPGYGRSDAPAGGAHHLGEDILALAEKEKLARFSVLAVSGGAPHALAVASAIPDRIASLALVGGLAPLTEVGATCGLSRSRRTVCRLLRLAPFLIPMVAGTIGWRLAQDASAALACLEERMPAVDRTALQENSMHGILAASFSEAVRSGGAGIAADARFYLTGPPIDFDRANMPASVWHGEMDNTVPIRMGAELARRLPQGRLFLLPGEGHYSLPLRHHRPILRKLLADQRA